jgi:hypothetical protein
MFFKKALRDSSLIQ